MTQNHEAAFRQSDRGVGPSFEDVVALIDDVPEKGLQRGQVGTIVEMLAPDVFEVEFSDLG